MRATGITTHIENNHDIIIPKLLLQYIKCASGKENVHGYIDGTDLILSVYERKDLTEKKHVMLELDGMFLNTDKVLRKLHWAKTKTNVEFFVIDAGLLLRGVPKTK